MRRSSSSTIPTPTSDRAGIALVAGLIRELEGRAMGAFAARTPELLEVADRVVVLSGGRVVEPGRMHSAARAQRVSGVAESSPGRSRWDRS
jgi:ABC-type sugar transport system ATPase subunit